MKERPIIMSGPMVRAIIAGRKTQTRQLIRGVSPDHHSPHQIMPAADYPHHDLMFGGKAGSVPPTIVPVAYHVGDRLWIKEAFAVVAMLPDAHYLDGAMGSLGLRKHGGGELDGTADLRVESGDAVIHYREHPTTYAALRDSPGFTTFRTSTPDRWRSPSHMPRWASRITLEITEVRVQRLQQISDDDSIVEGARHFPDLPSRHRYAQDARWSMEEPKSTADCLGSPRFAFANYVNKLHRKPRQPDIWEVNPWAWAITFARLP